MNVKVLKKLVGKPTKIRKKDNFGLTGVIKDIIGTTVEYETQQKTGYMEADDIKEISERPRLAFEETCRCKGHVWIRKNATEVCPYCNCGAK